MLELVEQRWSEAGAGLPLIVARCGRNFAPAAGGLPHSKALDLRCQVLWVHRMKSVLQGATGCLAYLFREAARFHFGEEALDFGVAVEAVQLLGYVLVD